MHISFHRGRKEKKKEKEREFKVASRCMETLSLE